MMIALAAAVLLGCAGDAQQEEVEQGTEVPAATSPDNVAVDVPTFDAEAAHALLRRQVEFGPRVPNTAGHRAQLAWMVDYLRQRADTVETQAFTYNADGKTLQLANVIARFNPESPRRILLLAHWDTRPTADEELDEAKRAQPIDGANDGASGVAVLLQLADMLSKQKAPIGVDLLFTDGEDYAPGHMYLGATHFAANLGAYRPMYGVLIDMVGDQNPRFPVEGNSREYAPEVVHRVWSLAAELGYGEMFPQTTTGAITDDHIPLNQAGIRTIDIIDFDYGPGNSFWHTTADVVANTSPAGLRAVGTLLAHLVYRGG